MSRIFQGHRKLYIGKPRQVDYPRIEYSRSQGCLQAELAIWTRNSHLGHNRPLPSLEDRTNHLEIVIRGIGRAKEIRIHGHGGIFSPQGINRPRASRICQSKQEAPMRTVPMLLPQSGPGWACITKRPSSAEISSDRSKPLMLVMSSSQYA